MATVLAPRSESRSRPGRRRAPTTRKLSSSNSNHEIDPLERQQQEEPQHPQVLIPSSNKTSDKTADTSESDLSECSSSHHDNATQSNRFWSSNSDNKRQQQLEAIREWLSSLSSRFVPQTITTATITKINGKTAISSIMTALIVFVVWDATMRDPADRYLQPDFSEKFLLWVQAHPTKGLLAILLVIATAVILMIPIGTPLTLGCGYIYKGAYGWRMGLTVATVVAMGGSALGAVVCFLLGRYLMREQVRKWVRKYPLFDAIDVAAAEHGLRIMAMLYLTPILPLGPVSYMCGTTSMALSSFVLAKIASLPLMLLYAFIGASTGALIGNGKASQEELQKIEENEGLIVSGIALSFVMIAGITRYIKKELNKILERQKKFKPGETEQSEAEGGAAMHDVEEAALELGVTAPRHRRRD